MSESPVLLSVEGAVATLSLNRPPRNTMTREVMACFAERLEEVRSTPAARVLIVTSVGKHFCAGAELGADIPGEAPALGGPPGTADRLREVYAPFLALMDLPIPTIAAVGGAAVGGGLGLALACDFRVVCPETRFMAPFVRLGIHPGMALTYLLPSIVGAARAMEMLLTGDEVRGELALSWGLANRCVPEPDLLDEAYSLAAQIAAGAPAVVRWTKRAVHRAIGLDPRAAADVEAMAQALTFGTKDAEEGMRAFLEKRVPEFTGS